MSDAKQNSDRPEPDQPQRRSARDDFREQLKRIRDDAVGDLKKSLGMPKEGAGPSQPNGISPGGRRSSGRSPSLSGNVEEGLRARASETASESYLTGQAYLDHQKAQEQDDAAGFNPQTEREFNTDIRRLDEEKLRQELLPPVASEYIQSVGRERQILDAYKRLGYEATDNEPGSVSMNYPDTGSHEYRHTPSHWALKEAFRAGYRDKQEGKELSKLTREEINALKALGAAKAKEAMQRAQRARRSETYGSGGDMPRAARPSNPACPACGRTGTGNAIFCLACGEDLSDEVVHGHTGAIPSSGDQAGGEHLPCDDLGHELRGHRSETAKPSAPGKGHIQVTGVPLTQHREKRQTPGYEPKSDVEQLMDAKDAGQYYKAATAGGMTESANGEMGLEGVRRIYHKLGQGAVGAGDPKGEVRGHYPQADPAQVERDMVDQTTTGMRILKEAFKDGYTGRELKPISEILPERRGRTRGATARPSGIVGSLLNKIRGPSESGVTSNAVAGVRGSQTANPDAAYARKLLSEGYLRDGDIDTVLSLLDSGDQGALDHLRTIVAQYRGEGIGPD